MKTIKIFLASSEELKPEREIIAGLEGNLNEKLSPLGLNIHFVRWEYLDSSMGPEHKQAEYNKALLDCEMCMVMYWTKFGEYTTKELDLAYKQLCAGENPKKLYVYFKDGGEISLELQRFRDGFPSKYGHFYSRFGNADTLKAEFLLQFIGYQKKYLQYGSFFEVKNGQVGFGGKNFVDLENVPFVGNNEEYNLLIKNINKTQKLLSVTAQENPEYSEYVIELADLKERQKKMENSLWDTALMITRLSTTQCSERLKCAMDMFSHGNNKGAIATLGEYEIYRDIDHNLKLVQLGEEGKKGLAININELLLRIKALKNEQAEKWYFEVEKLFEKCIEAGRNILSDEKMAVIQYDYCSFLLHQNQFKKAEDSCRNSLEIYKRLIVDNPQEYELSFAWALRNLALICSYTMRYEESAKMCAESLVIFRRLAMNNLQTYGHGLATLLNDLAHLNRVTKQYEESDKLYKEVIEIYKKLAKDNPVYEESLAVALNNYAVWYSDVERGHYLKICEDSEQLYRESVKICRRLLKNSPKYEPALVTSLTNFALMFTYTSGWILPRNKESEKMLKESLEICRRLVKCNPPAYEPKLAGVLNALAILYCDNDLYDESAELYKDALEILRRLAKNNPQVYEKDLAWVICNYAQLCYKVNRYKESESLCKESIEIRRRLVKNNPKVFEPSLAASLSQLACIYSKVEQYAKSEELYLETIEIYKRQVKEHPQVYEPSLAWELYSLAYLYSDIKRYEESEKCYKESIEIYRRLFSDYPKEFWTDLTASLSLLDCLYFETNRFDESDEIGREIDAIHDMMKKSKC